VGSSATAFSDSGYLLYVVTMNYLTIFSGVLFLLAFIMLGLVALRINRVFSVSTGWPLFFVGPVGALVYSVYTIVHGGGPAASSQALAVERWLAYGVFLLGSALCWWGVRRFYVALRGLEAEGRKAAEKHAQTVTRA
jgi:hypothetical protein